MPCECYLMTATLQSAFACTYASECLFYVLRKVPSVVKAEWKRRLGFSVEFLGVLDSLFLGAYTIGQFIAGWLCRRFGGGRMVAAALAGSALSCAAIAGFPYGLRATHAQHGSNQVSATVLAILMALSFSHGGFQALGYPGCITVMTAWTRGEESSRRASLMGIWGTNVAVGGVLGSVIGAELAGTYGWRAAFVVPCPVLMVTAICSYYFVKDGPSALSQGSDVTSSAKTKQHGDSGDTETVMETAELLEDRAGTEAIDAARTVAGPNEDDRSSGSRSCAVLWPGVPAVCAAYFCLKFARYCLMLWLPYYFSVLGFDTATAGLMATSFEVGGIFGSVLMSWLGARGAERRGGLGRHVGTAALLVFLASICLLVCTVLFRNRLMFTGVLAMSLVGLLINAGDFALPTLVSQDLARRSGRGEVEAVGAVVGAVNGCGSLGTVLQSPVTAWLSMCCGWDSVFWLLVALCIACATILVCAGPLHDERNEFKRKLRQQRRCIVEMPRPKETAASVSIETAISGDSKA